MRLFLLCFLCLGAELVNFGIAFAAPAEKPNVVIIFADDLGYGDLSCYGATKLKTPNIDKLAAEGRRFTDAHSASAVCTPSRYALITGRYPFRKGLSKPVFLRTGLVIDEERTTLADVMKNAGYSTACIGKWHLGFGGKTPDWNGDLKPGPLELGFDYYYGVPVVNSHPPFVYVENHRVVGLVPDDPFVYGKKAQTRMIHEKMGFNQIGGADAAHALYDDYAVGTHLAEKSVEWIEKNKDAPFFLYLSTTNIHHPFTPAKRFQGTSECGLYGDFVHELDWIVGEVMTTLEKNGIAENTLVIFTSDNGGMINVTGQRAIKQGHQLNGELLGFKFDAWEGGHRVPFIARWPGKVEAGSVSDQLISNIDLMATMAALTEQKLKPEDGPDSFNVLPALTENPGKPIRNELVLSAAKGSHLVLRQGDWAYISGKGGGGFGSAKPGTHGFGGPAAINFAGQINSDIVEGKLKKDAPSEQLYNLKSDLNQNRNVIQENGEKAESLRSRLAEIKAGNGTRPDAKPTPQPAAKTTPNQQGSASVRGFETIQLTDEFHSESAALADMDNDDDIDVVYGPFLFHGPDFKEKTLIDKPNPFKTATYSNNFFSYADDLDGDGWKDVLVLGFPRRADSTYWYRNPGKDPKPGPWEKFVVFEGVGNESPVWADVTGDGQKEVLCSMDGQFGFVAPADRAKPQERWTFTAITPPKSTGGKFTHGLGFGDVNSDGRNDLLEKTGWWEQPEKEGMWIKHPFTFSADKGGSQMFAYDFDGDGDNDVVSAINAHGYGLSWFENTAGEGGKINFTEHRIMGAKPGESDYGVAFSQLHGLKLADIDGDGVKDIVTGKRYFAHGGKDPGGKDIPVIYWFRTVRSKAGNVDFVPYQIHDASGVGVDVTVGDVNGDDRLDVVTGNKKGCFVHLQTGEAVAAPQAKAKTESPVEKPSSAVRLEGESLKVLKRAGSLAPQRVRNVGGGQWSAGAQIWWKDAKVGDVIEFSLPVKTAGTYRIAAAMTKARDYGIVEFALDGEPISERMDFYSKGVALTGEVVLAEKLKLTAGEHVLSVTIIGANEAAEKRYMFGLDYVSLSNGNGQAAKTNPAPAPKAPPAKPKGKIKEGNSLEAEPLSPAEQQTRFKVPEGFVVDLIASEETGLAKPTSIAFDDAGRLWATTAVEYPSDRTPDIWKKEGRDKVLVIDSPHLRELQPTRTFADGLVMPMSVLPHANGAFIAQGPEIFFLEDEDGDGKADHRKVLLKGFGVQDTHTLPHQLARMPGGRITFSQGVLNNGTIVDAKGTAHPFNRTLVASMNFTGTDLDIIGAGMNNIWAWGHGRTGRVFIHEANDWGYSLVPFEEDSSYPSFRTTTIHPRAPVHPPTAEGLDLGGTGFSGIAICDDRSGSFPAPYAGQFFIANPIFGKINAATATPGSNDVWKFEKQPDLVTCEDPMFRPVYVAFGPDGCLYIVDWYNRIISHNEVGRDHPARDKDHGRIWRVRHESQVPREIPDLTKTPTGDLVNALESDSTWEMRAAWHQIAKREDRSVIPALSAFLTDPEKPIDSRIHALWSLEELSHFDPEIWSQLLTDPDTDLRREAVRSLSSLKVSQSKAAPLLRKLAGEVEWRVRYEVLRYFRKAEGRISGEDLAWLRNWGSSEKKATKIKGPKGEYLALDGSYQRAFQDFLFQLAESKTQLPVIIESKWNRVLTKNPNPVDPKTIAARLTEVKAALPKADLVQGKLLVESVCLTCHAIGDKGIGFAPPLDGSGNRDIDGLLTAIIDPDAAIENVFRSYRIETNDGSVIEGFNQAENPNAITILNMGGAKTNVPIKNIKAAGYIDGKSSMPDLTGAMSPEQVAAIVAYLQTLK